jgi:hypothetical protein
MFLRTAGNKAEQTDKVFGRLGKYWRIYFWTHVFMVVACAIFTRLDSMGKFDILYNCLGILTMFSVLYLIISPIISIRLIYRASKERSVDTLFGVADLFICGIHWWCFFIACC